MLLSPGDSPHVIAVIQAYTTYATAVRALLHDLSSDHAGDIAAKLAEIDPRVVRETDRIPVALTRLRADESLLFERAPTGQHLFRLLATASPGGDRGSLAAAVDRMQVEDKRRCAYAAIKKLMAEGRPVPSPQPGDTNVASAPPGTAPSTPHRRFRAQSGEIGGGQSDAAPVDAADRDAQRGHLALQPMKKIRRGY